MNKIMAIIVVCFLTATVSAKVLPKYSNFDTAGDFDGWIASGATAKDPNLSIGAEAVRLTDQSWLSLDFSGESKPATPYTTLEMSLWVYEPSTNVTLGSPSMGVLLQTKDSATGPSILFDNVIEDETPVRYIGYKDITGTFNPVARAVEDRFVELKISADCDLDKFEMTYNGVVYDSTIDPNGNEIMGFPFFTDLSLINMVTFSSAGTGTNTFELIDNVNVAVTFDNVIPSCDDFDNVGSYDGWVHTGSSAKVSDPAFGDTGQSIEINPQTWLYKDFTSDPFPYNNMICSLMLYELSDNAGSGRSLNFLFQSTNLSGGYLTIDDVGGVRKLRAFKAGVWSDVCTILTDQWIELIIEANSDTQKMIVTYNGVEYDNGGGGYDFNIQLPKIQKFMFSNAGVYNTTYVDNVCLQTHFGDVLSSCDDFNTAKAFDGWFHESGALKVQSPVRGGTGEAVIIQQSSWLFKNFRIDPTNYTALGVSAWIYESSANIGRSAYLLFQDSVVSTGVKLCFDELAGTRYLGYLDGSTFTAIAPAILDQYVSVVVKADCQANKFAVIYDGTLYDNSGQNYDFAEKLYRIDQIMFSNAGSSGETYVDDVCIAQLIPTACGDFGTEYNSADFNQDCVVNMDDFAFLAAYWMEIRLPDQCPDPAECTYPINSPSASPSLMFLKADIDQNSSVDSFDLEILFEQWLESTAPAN